MNKDTVKTLIGLAVIVVIIAGAFWYGDRQHQQQLSQNQKATQATSAPKANSTTALAPSASAKPAPTKSLAPKAATPTPTHTPAPTLTPTPVAAAPSSIPQTGAASDLVPLAVLSGAVVLYRRSARRAAAHAAQTARTTRAI